MYLTNFVSINPSHLLSQEDTLDWIASMHEASSCEPLPHIREKLHQIGLGDKKIKSRGLHSSDFTHTQLKDMQIYDLSEHPKGISLKDRHAVYEESVDKLVEEFYPTPTLLPDHILHVTCTGYVSPSPVQKRVSQLNPMSNCTITHVYHMGCYAAFVALRIAQGFNALNASQTDIVHTEFCSLHMDPSNHSHEQLVVQSLFSDGFIKYSGSQNPQNPSLEIRSLSEELIPNSTQEMNWHCSDHHFSMGLKKTVPIFITRFLLEYLNRLMIKASLTEFNEKTLFAIHPGGTSIIFQIAKLLGLKEHQYRHSYEVFEKRGNMSSATLPHIWQSILNDTTVPENTYIVSFAFGPGLTISGGIFRKRGV